MNINEVSLSIFKREYKPLIMKDLTNQEKVNLIRELCAKHDITAYELGEKTTVSNVAAHNIITGVTKNPRGKTLNIILSYIKNKVNKKDISNERNKEQAHLIAETSAKYDTNNQKIFNLLLEIQTTLRIDHDAIADGIKKIYLNTENIKDENINISSSITSLISAIKGSDS